MGYYDEDGKSISIKHNLLPLTPAGHYHSFRHGLHRAAEHVKHGAESIISGGHRHEGPRFEKEEIDISIGGRSEAPRRASVEASVTPNTVTIPTHHIRLGDLLILQGRPCQVIKITTSSSTGQHRYLGVDLFTKQLHEESSFISNPSPSVIVQTMLGPIFKQYRVLDLQDGMGMSPLPSSCSVLTSLSCCNDRDRRCQASPSRRRSIKPLVPSH